MIRALIFMRYSLVAAAWAVFVVPHFQAASAAEAVFAEVVFAAEVSVVVAAVAPGHHLF